MRRKTTLVSFSYIKAKFLILLALISSSTRFRNVEGRSNAGFTELSTDSSPPNDDDDDSSCLLIHELSTGVCIRAGLTSYPTKKDLPKYIHALILSENRLAVLNRTLAMTTFTKLRELDLSRNVLSLIEEGALEGAKHLRKLDLSWNRLTRIHRAAFRGAQNLLVLDLSYNLLDVLEPGAFKGLRKLNRLWLQRNLIKTISEDTFEGLRGPNLEFLFLQQNQINTIKNGSFHMMTSLVMLQIADNLLKNLSLSLVIEMASVARFVNWEGNPWSCDCRFSNEAVQSLKNNSFQEELPVIRCVTTMSCESKVLHLTEKSDRKETVSAWSGGAIAGLFFAVSFTITFVLICVSLSCCKTRRQNQNYGSSENACYNK